MVGRQLGWGMQEGSLDLGGQAAGLGDAGGEPGPWWAGSGAGGCRRGAWESRSHIIVQWDHEHKPCGELKGTI